MLTPPHPPQIQMIWKADAKRYTLGIVYEPDTVDTQDDYATADTIEQAAWAYLADLQGLAKTARVVLRACVDRRGIIDLDVTDLLAKGAGLDDQHAHVTEDVGTVVESYVAPVDFTLDGAPVKRGAWLLGVVWSPEMFAKILAGERTGLSLYGRAERV